MNSALNTNTSAFDLDQQWIADHYDELAGQHAEEWIAVRGQQVIAHDSDLSRLLSQLSDLEHTCVEFIDRQAPRIEDNLTPAASSPSTSK